MCTFMSSFKIGIFALCNTRCLLTLKNVFVVHRFGQFFREKLDCFQQVNETCCIFIKEISCLFFYMRTREL